MSGPFWSLAVESVATPPGPGTPVISPWPRRLFRGGLTGVDIDLRTNVLSATPSVSLRFLKGEGDTRSRLVVAALLPIFLGLALGNLVTSFGVVVSPSVLAYEEVTLAFFLGVPKRGAPSLCSAPFLSCRYFRLEYSVSNFSWPTVESV